MGRKTEKSSESLPKTRRASSIEAREEQLIALAVDRAEEQLRNGTASSQLITHFLRLGSTKEKTEQLKLQKEIALLDAKAESYKSQKRVEELYSKALEAMRKYSGNGDVDIDD